MKYGYAQVSTRQQDLEGQLRQLEEERCDRVYFEKITGTKSDRPEFQKLLQEIETGDTLVVTKLDRFARSTQHALNTIKLLFEKGVRINVLNLGIIENMSTGRLIFTIFSAFWFINLNHSVFKVENKQQKKYVEPCRNSSYYFYCDCSNRSKLFA